jgi:hypothetical protein
MMNSNWSNVIKKGGKILKLWKLEMISKEPGKINPTLSAVIRQHLLAVLKDPPLPMPELVREEFNVYKKTLLQDYLYEAIFKESKSESTASTSFSLGELPTLSDLPEVDIAGQIQTLEASALSLIEECKTLSDKEALFSLRWYRVRTDEGKSDQLHSISLSGLSIASTQGSSIRSSSDQEEEKGKSSKASRATIVALTYSLLKTISFYCKVCSCCILRDKDPVTMLGEYCKRWAGYCAAMIELDKTLKPLCKVINDCYEVLYPNFPRYPKFSVSRAMVTLWKAKVFSKIYLNLFEAFSSVLVVEREEHVKEGKQKTEDLKKSKEGLVEEKKEGPPSANWMQGMGEGNMGFERVQNNPHGLGEQRSHVARQVRHVGS